MPRKHERTVIPALSFLIPELIILWVYASLGFAPWGDRTILVTDMSSQYVSFFCALKSGDLLFSWSKALGTGYIGVFSYYVSSPLSFLTLLVPNEYMPIGLMFLTVLKIALTGLTFAIFAQRRFPNCGVSALICAVCYALSAYNAAYSLCIMWLDGVIWLPLILLALERILAGRSVGPFLAALTVCFLSTWYISYIVGIFCALYLCARLAALKPAQKELRQVLTRFFGGAACALGLTAWMCLPTFLAMFSGKFRGGNETGVSGLVTCSPILVLGQFLPGRYSSLDYGALPYVFCGTGTLILAAVYFSSWETDQREKLANQVVLSILFVSMVFVPFDRAWHLFQRPNWFPFRYAFLLSFFVLYIALQALWPALESLREKWGKRTANAAAFVLVFIAIVDMGLNTKGMLANIQERCGSDSWQYYYTDYIATSQLTASAQADAGDKFCRMGAIGDRGQNGPLSFGYPGMTHYSSLYNYQLNSLLKSLGFAQDWYWSSYHGATPLTDALFDVRYVISPGGLPGYEPIDRQGNLTLWKNPDTVPLAFMARDEELQLNGGTPFERQNDLISGLLGEETAIFVPVEAETDSQEYSTTFSFIGSGKPIYVDLSAFGHLEVLVNGVQAADSNNVYSAHIYYIGTPPAGELWTVSVCGADWDGQLWEFDADVLHAAVAALNKAEILEVDNDGRVQLAAQTDGVQTLLTTIPAENGWTAFVDGERAETRTWLNTFLALELPAGEHQVELRYTAPGLIPGAALGGASVFALVLARIWSRQKRKSNNTVQVDSGI